MQAITEESKVHEQWYVDAKAVTADTLPAFITKLTTEYQHDYGTICHAVAAAGIAAMSAVNASPAGGITGFQASCIMWEFIKRWMHIDGPARLLQYDNMLFPQYEHKFRAIDKDTWEYLQAKATKDLADKVETLHPRVRAHMETIVAGTVPFGYRVED